MGCGQSKDDVESTHTRIKMKRKSTKTEQPRDESTQLVTRKTEKEESGIKINRSKENEEVGDSDLTVEELICDGISGKTEFFSPKRSDDPNVNEKGDQSEKLRIGDYNNQNLSIEEIICDGISGKTEYHSPKRFHDDNNEKNEENDDGNGNGNISIEGKINDGFLGKSVYSSPKKSGDGVEVEDKEVLVEEKTGEDKSEKTEEVSGDGKSEKTKYSSPEKAKHNEEIELLPKEKESEIDTTIHVTGFAFDHLLSWWKTREI